MRIIEAAPSRAPRVPYRVTYGAASPGRYEQPRRAHPDDAGADLFASETVVIPSRSWRTVSTNLRLDIHPQTVGLVVPRSGLARESGVTILNSPGVIDSGYTGSVDVPLINHGEQPYTVRAGDRIAQLLILNIQAVEFAHVELGTVAAEDDGGRGANGFGSTGR